jgi:hypothetical protein
MYGMFLNLLDMSLLGQIFSILLGFNDESSWPRGGTRNKIKRYMTIMDSMTECRASSTAPTPSESRGGRTGRRRMSRLLQNMSICAYFESGSSSLRLPRHHAMRSSTDLIQLCPTGRLLVLPMRYIYVP